MGKKPKIENKPIYCHAWVSRVDDIVICNSLPCCGFCHSQSMEKVIKEEGSFKDYNKIGRHQLITYTEQDMIDCFTAGVKFARDMMSNPSNSEYIMIVNDNKMNINTKINERKGENI